MTDDILREASRALYATTEGTDESARFTRARVLASLHGQKRRKASKVVVLVPLAAILLGGSALAANGGRIPEAVYQMAEVIGIAAPAEDDGDKVVSARGNERPVEESLHPTAIDPADIEGEGDRDGVENATDEPEPEPVHVDEPEPRVAPPAIAAANPSASKPAVAAKNPAASKPAPRVVKPEPPEDESAKAYELYRQAHRLHFEQRDAAGALAAWDEYLREAPGGRFALEASYNRGICFVRLGRTTEALRVLEPFADGLYGGYRQAEAKQLVAALKGEEE